MMVRSDRKQENMNRQRSIDITYQYAHLFPSKQIEMAEKLDDLGKGDFENVS